METSFPRSVPAGAHFLRTGEGRAPLFVPPAPADAGPQDPRLREMSREEIFARLPLARRRGRELYRSGRLGPLADFAEDLERTAWSRDDGGARGLGLVLAGTAALEQGRVEFARMRFQAVRDLTLEDEDVEGLRRQAHVGLGRTALVRGAPSRAVRHFHAALSGDGPRPEPGTASAALRGLGAVLHTRSCLDSAATHYRHAMRRARSVEDHLESALSIAGLARVELRRREAADLRLARLALSTAELAASPLARAEALRVRAAHRSATGDDDDRSAALRDLRRALAVTLQTGAVLRQARVERDAADVLREMGRPREAARRMRRARELMKPKEG